MVPGTDSPLGPKISKVLALYLGRVFAVAMFASVAAVALRRPVGR